jgi:hypothetical protein
MIAKSDKTMEKEQFSFLIFEMTTLGVNFTNFLRATFLCADPKSAKNTVKLLVFFALLWSAHKKSARKIFLK